MLCLCLICVFQKMLRMFETCWVFVVRSFKLNLNDCFSAFLCFFGGVVCVFCFSCTEFDSISFLVFCSCFSFLLTCWVEL